VLSKVRRVYNWQRYRAWGGGHLVLSVAPCSQANVPAGLVKVLGCTDAPASGAAGHTAHLSVAERAKAMREQRAAQGARRRPRRDRDEDNPVVEASPRQMRRLQAAEGTDASQA
jgi:hypothetical protein